MMAPLILARERTQHRVSFLLPHADATKNPAENIGPGTRVPGLLATCFTWLQAGRLKFTTG
jgi:hypothetical protein